MNFKVFELKGMGANCYILWDKETKSAMLIDPGEEDARIDGFIEKNELNPIYIALTHTHFDHINGVKYYSEKYGAKILAHELDAPGLTDNSLNLSAFFGIGESQKPADILVKDNDEIMLGNSLIKIIHTPGHTVGGICFYTDAGVFAGDTLFFESIGRSDFPGGNGSILNRSIVNKLFTLPDETVIYPGHGQHTTIGHEKQFNFFVKR